eukprot:gene31278-40648_t
MIAIALFLYIASRTFLAVSCEETGRQITPKEVTPNILVVIASVSRNWKDQSKKSNNRIHLLHYMLVALDHQSITIQVITDQKFNADLKCSVLTFNDAGALDRLAAYKYLDNDASKYDYFVFLEDDSYISANQILRFIELKKISEREMVANTSSEQENLLCLVRVSQVQSSFYMEDNNNEGILYGTYLSEKLFRPKYFYSASFIVSSSQYKTMQHHNRVTGCFNHRNRHSHKIESINLGLNCGFSCMWPIESFPDQPTAIDHRAIVLHIGSRDTVFRSDGIQRPRVNAFAFVGNNSYECDSTTDRLCIPANYSVLLEYDKEVLRKQAQQSQQNVQRRHIVNDLNKQYWLNKNSTTPTPPLPTNRFAAAAASSLSSPSMDAAMKILAGKKRKEFLGTPLNGDTNYTALLRNWQNRQRLRQDHFRREALVPSRVAAKNRTV